MPTHFPTSVRRLIPTPGRRRPLRGAVAAALATTMLMMPGGCAMGPATPDPDPGPPPATADPAGERVDRVPEATPPPTPRDRPAPSSPRRPAPTPLPAPAPAPAPDPAPAPAPATPTSVTLRPGLVVQPAVAGEPGSVRLDAIACLDAGWLEQVACGVGSREHESLLVVEIPASEVHAAMLLAGLEPGQPGRWSVDAEGRTRLDAPVGDPIAIGLEWEGDDGSLRRATPADWIISEDGGRRMDSPTWRFGGSRLVDDRGRLVDEADAGGAGTGGGDGADIRYLADFTGSIIGLVTFGDEVIGLEEVIPDATDYAEPAWMVDTAAVPPPGTEVTIILRRAPGS